MSSATVQIMNALTSKDPIIMHLMRCLCYYLVLHNIQLRAVHILSVHNTIADSISCNMLQVIRRLVPLADVRTTHSHPSTTQATPLYPAPGLAIARLEGIAESLIADSLAENSWRAYSSAQASFQSFCHSLRMPALPAGEHLLLLYAAHLSQRVCHGTVRSYMSAIRHLQVSLTR